ncbi:MAG: glycoside hydrolase family 16 protein [Spirochaetales bacterium]|nr:glycoside hydrolase family 16 protein [Spirochaetales bacterium]
MLKKILLSFFAMIFIILFFGCVNTPVTGHDKEWQLVFSDEFNDKELNTEYWSYQTGTGTDAYPFIDGWGNKELQYYMEKNVTIADGNLVITAMDDGHGSKKYTSGRITTASKVSIKFGKIEARVKFPSGKGLWAAVWMLGNNLPDVKWPACGEIDICEMVGGEGRGDATVYGTAHWSGENDKYSSAQGSLTIKGGILADDFHLVTFLWDVDKMQWFLDGDLFHEVPINSYYLSAFQKGFYLLINLAVGGTWPGTPDDSTAFPQSLYVDYVKVYRDVNLVEPTPFPSPIPTSTSPEDATPAPYDEAIKEGFHYFDGGKVEAWGPGEQINFYATKQAFEGDAAIAIKFPGDNWGGIYYMLKSPIDASRFKYVSFMIALPASIADLEVKAEGPQGTGNAVKLSLYEPVAEKKDYRQYKIPLADFEMDLKKVQVPFELWNPVNADGGWAGGEVIFDGVCYE